MACSSGRMSLLNASGVSRRELCWPGVASVQSRLLASWSIVEHVQCLVIRAAAADCRLGCIFSGLFIIIIRPCVPC